MVAPARLTATGLTTTISVCLRFRPTIFGSNPMRPAVTSNERHASSRSQRQHSLVGMKDSRSFEIAAASPFSRRGLNVKRHF